MILQILDPWQSRLHAKSNKIPASVVVLHLVYIISIHFFKSHRFYRPCNTYQIQHGYIYLLNPMYNTRIQLYIHWIASASCCGRQFPSISFRGDSSHISLDDSNFESISSLQNITRSCPLGSHGYFTAALSSGILCWPLYEHLFWGLNMLSNQNK